MSDTNSLLVAYVDGELDPEAVSKVERLIATDAQARRTVEIYRETAVLLRAACAEGFYASGAASLLSAAPARRRWAPRPVAWAIAASVAACVAGFGGGTIWAAWPASAREELLGEIAEYHEVYARESRHLVEIPAEQSDELKAWLGQRLGRRLEIPDLRAAGLRFAGGRMLVAAGKPVAELMYSRERGAPVALCITRMDGRAAALRLDRRGALRLASWQDGKYADVVVGDLDSDTARGIAERAAEDMRG
jgi:anti-sigma factor RsiW